MLNINAPASWNGSRATTRLGVRWYRNAVRFGDHGDDATATFTIGAASVDHSIVQAGITMRLRKTKRASPASQCGRKPPFRHG